MTTPLPGDVVLWLDHAFPAQNGPNWKSAQTRTSDEEFRARPVAADDAVLGVVEKARAVEVATRPAADAPDMGRCLRAEAMAALDALFKALEVVDGR